MRVFVTGATGVMGRSVVSALVGAGHAVHGMARCDERARELAERGVVPYVGGLFDPDGLRGAFEDGQVDVVCNLATSVPVGLSALRRGAWRANDRIRTEGSRLVAEAARAAGVRRLVQESASIVYADGGDEWLDEDSPVCVNGATEPMAMAESHAQEFACTAREAVVLRLGTIVGDDDFTRWRLARARSGQPASFGPPDGWQHLVHAEDVGTAVLSALTAPGGTYNVGAEPVRRRDLAHLLAAAVGRDRTRFVPRPLRWVGGDRTEVLTRSQRVSSARLTRAAGWKPLHRELGRDWLPHVAHEVA